MSALRTLSYVVCFSVINEGTKPGCGLVVFLALMAIVSITAHEAAA